MPGRPAADHAMLEKFRGNQLDGPPVALVRQERFHLRQESTLQPLGGSLRGSLQSQPSNEAEISFGGVPGVSAGPLLLSRETGQRDQDLALQPVLRLTMDALAELALAEPILIRLDTHAMHRAVKSQRHDGMPGLVERGRFDL